jgi:hypothetical protein
MYKLSKNTFKFQSIQRNLKFYRTIEDNNMVLMTMPIEINNKSYTPFSYIIKCNMKEPIDVEGNVLNFYLKVRIWQDYNLLDEKSNYLKQKNTTSLYVYKENEYYKNGEIIFNKIKLIRDDKHKFKINDVCDKNYVELLNIDVKNILNNVNKYLSGNNKCKALIIRKKIDKYTTQYGAGLPERNDMLFNIVDMLSNLNLRKSLKLISKTGYQKVGQIDKINEYFRSKYDLENDLTPTAKINLERYLLNSNVEKVILNVYTDNEELFDKSSDILKMYLRSENNLIDENISPDGYKIETRIIKNDFVRVFEDDLNKKERQLEIEKLIPKYDKKTLNLALIDIPAYHEDEDNKDKDPKNFIRNIFKNNKVLTQFINYSEEKNIHTIMNSIKDLISAYGFIEYSLYENIGIKKDDILVGIGKVSGGNNEKIIAMSKIDKGEIYINIYGINKWMQLSESIFSINKQILDKVDIKKGGSVTSKGVEQWIQENIFEVLEQNRKVYTFIDANIRQTGFWNKINNKKFNKSLLDDLNLINKELLRLIRINYSDEIPDYFIYDDKKNNINKYSGIFKSENNTYYLIGKKQDTDQQPSNATKISHPKKQLKRPALYEINILGCNDEVEKDNIAKITQELRRMNITYDEHTSLPLPLYTIKRLSEYIIAQKNS